MNQMEYWADQLFFVLPFATLSEGCRLLAARTHRGISEAYLAAVLTWVRAHRLELGWTVPHVARGINPTGGKRFFAVLIRDDGSVELPANHHRHLRAGMTSTLKHASS